MVFDPIPLPEGFALICYFICGSKRMLLKPCVSKSSSQATSLYTNHLGELLKIQIPGLQPGKTQLESLGGRALNSDFHQIFEVIIMPSNI